MAESHVAEEQARPVLASMLRGLTRKCPRCGEGGLLSGYLKPHDHCAVCGEPVGRIKAHDAPPYITIFIVGHIVVPLMLLWERTAAPSLWLQAAVWLPATAIMSLALLPFVKGAWMGLMWSLRLTGDERQ